MSANFLQVDKKEDGSETIHRYLVTFKNSNTFNLTYKVYSKKTTKNGVMISNVKTKRMIFRQKLAFSEYMNFT